MKIILPISIMLMFCLNSIAQSPDNHCFHVIIQEYDASIQTWMNVKDYDADFNIKFGKTIIPNDGSQMKYDILRRVDNSDTKVIKYKAMDYNIKFIDIELVTVNSETKILKIIYPKRIINYILNY